ncbi:type IV pilus modification protein PilV [Thioalkalivibrio sp. ALE23]|uniref:type IV pilus modification protein PilV n=1 Tax=Thioalkalivibrio sp. ALE23 TaxID=1265495 RepID=UPI00036B2E61|nr:type IV pilus modification protein PilV [Thioalkalivibrio sp. ALE23]
MKNMIDDPTRVPAGVVTYRRISGLTLIEVLVALIVLSVGVLGLAGLQITSLQYSQSSYERSIAVMQANDLVERLWAGLCDPDADFFDDGNVNVDEDPIDAIKDAWENDHTGLPNWDATLDDDSSPMIQLTISWDSRVDDDETESFEHYFRLPRIDC